MRAGTRASALMVVLMLTACAGHDSKGMGGGAGGPSARDGDRGDGAAVDDGDGGTGDASASLAGDGGESAQTCEQLQCDLGQRCEMSASTPVCVASTCEELSCGATAVCVQAPSGTGYYCADNSCDDDLQCAAEQFCSSDHACVADACEPSAEQCQGSAVQRCASNGAGYQTTMTCGGAASFESQCTVQGGEAFCPCQADWDCPPYTACSAGRCEGTGKAASCTLPPSSFADATPSPEYGKRGKHWGGTSDSDVKAQPGTPFPDSTQVVMTPAVANLTDDNGDGVIDERDFPEVIFMTFCKAVKAGTRYSIEGILRAVHGGGPDKGEDLFAACGKQITWREGDATTGPSAASCPCSTEAATAADLDPSAGVAVGDLDNDGSPEIVVLTQTDRLRIYDRTGRFVAESASVGGAEAGNGSPAIANLDRKGLAEIVLGRVVATLKLVDAGSGKKLEFDSVFTGTKARGINLQGPISCIADVTTQASDLEVIAGASVYHLPRAPEPGELSKNVSSPADCTAADVPNLADDVREAELKAYCEAQLVLVWDGKANNPSTPALNEGFCAIADIWGADHGTLAMPNLPGPANPLDEKPEVILIASGHLQIFDGESGTLIYDQAMDGDNKGGGAPNVDDFDGDGFPEVGTAFGSAYQMIDLQPPTASCPAWPEVWPTALPGGPLKVPAPSGDAPRTPPVLSCHSDADCGSPEFACNEAASACVCLHNGWKRETQDASSQVTGSSLFDFNGDGAAEVVYNDECFFRVYNGIDGEEVFREYSESRTRTENPVIADVDNDGNAEIVFGSSTESGFCSSQNGGKFKPANRDVFNPGIEVWGDASDRWVSARRIYNQHGYHVTNVLEGGGIPQSEPPSYRPLNGRLYNSYRSQPRSGEGIAAPNLAVDAVQLSSPDAACGQLATNDLSITVRVENRGDLRVGPGVPIGFYGEWSNLEAPLNDDTGKNLTVSLTTPLEPGAQAVLSVSYKPSYNQRDTLPERVRVIADDGDTQRECLENDNDLRVVTSEAARPLADLGAKLTATGSCDDAAFGLEVTNSGAIAADAVSYTLYLGDPSAGGTPIASATLSNPVGPGETVERTVKVPNFPEKDVKVYVVVDPQDAVPECNDANNIASVDVECAPPIIF